MNGRGALASACSVTIDVFQFVPILGPIACSFCAQLPMLKDVDEALVKFRLACQSGTPQQPPLAVGMPRTRVEQTGIKTSLTKFQRTPCTNARASAREVAWISGSV